MIVFKFTFLALQLMYNSLGSFWGKGTPNEIKNEFDEQVMLFFNKIQNYNNSDFTVAIKPFLIGFSIFCILESFLVGQIIGEKHLLVKQMIMFSSGFFFLVLIGFRSDKNIHDLIKIAKSDMKRWIEIIANVTFWVGLIILTAWFVFEVSKNPSLTPEEFVVTIFTSFNYFYLIPHAILISGPAIFHLLMWILPVSFARLFSSIMRTLVKKTINEGNTTPFKIIFILISGLLLLDVFFVMKSQI